jgi:hypothetical protein
MSPPSIPTRRRSASVFFLHPKTTETAPFGYLLEVVQEGFDQIPLGQMSVSMTMNG